MPSHPSAAATPLSETEPGHAQSSLGSDSEFPRARVIACLSEDELSNQYVKIFMALLDRLSKQSMLPMLNMPPIPPMQNLLPMQNMSSQDAVKVATYKMIRQIVEFICDANKKMHLDLLWCMFLQVER